MYSDFKLYVYVCVDINIFCLSDLLYTPGVASIDVYQCSKYFKNLSKVNKLTEMLQ